MSLDEFFSEQPVDETQEEMVEERQEEQQELELDVESKDDAEVETKADKSETTADKTEEQKEAQEWTFAAVKDERQKRQEAQKELEKLRQELELLKNPKTEEMPDVFDDQKAFAEHIKHEMQGEFEKYKFNLSREMMMEAKPDYVEVEEYVKQLAQTDKAFVNYLLAEAQNHTNQAKFLYDQGKKHREFKEMQNIDSVREKLKAELRAELEAEMKSKKEQKTAKVSDITPSLAKARASDKDTSEDDSSLENLFGR